MKRLLCMVGGMNAGGAETFLMKVYRQLDKTEYQMDFCVAQVEKGYYDDEILNLGGKIFHTVPKSKNPFKSFISIKNIVRKGNYKYVLRVSQNSLSVLELLAAKFGGAKILAFRSSNSGTCGSKVEDFVHYLFKPLVMVVPNVKIAPSKVAGEFMFGKKLVKKNKVQFLNNGINTDVYKFDTQVRNYIRKELDVEDKFVIGHIGRFNFQKNHHFLIEVFGEIYKRNPNSILFLIGDGELKDEMEKYVHKLGIYESVRFFGVVGNVPEIMLAMDVILFPSFFEGMPNVLIEAQASGLPCIVSDTITREANITGLIEYVSLQLGKEKWADLVINYKDGRKRDDISEIYKQNGYDINYVCKKFTDLIFRSENLL